MKVKGSNITFARGFADRRLPGEGLAALMAHLSESDRALLVAVIPSGWYELSLQHRVFAALDVACARDGEDTIRSFARYVAEQDLTRVHRMFLRLRNPAVVLEKSGAYWNRFYDAGSWTVERVSPTHAQGSLTGIVEPHRVFCRFLAAYMERMFELAGAQVGRVKHVQCVLDGSPACVFEGRWDSEHDAVVAAVRDVDAPP